MKHIYYVIAIQAERINGRSFLHTQIGDRESYGDYYMTSRLIGVYDEDMLDSAEREERWTIESPSEDGVSRVYLCKADVRMADDDDYIDTDDVCLSNDISYLPGKAYEVEDGEIIALYDKHDRYDICNETVIRVTDTPIYALRDESELDYRTLNICDEEEEMNLNAADEIESRIDSILNENICDGDSLVNCFRGHTFTAYRDYSDNVKDLGKLLWQIDLDTPEAQKALADYQADDTVNIGEILFSLRK